MADEIVVERGKTTNLAGLQCGFWTVIHLAETRGNWICRCLCGNERHVRSSVLIRNLRKERGSRGCGCDFVLMKRAYESNVIRCDGCWRWSGARHGFGYGRVHLRKGVKVSAHRMSWILHNGPIPDGQCVLHRCDNPECTNPDHLFLGSNADNTADMKSKNRHMFGESHRGSKVTEEMIPQIIRDWIPRRFTRKMVAQKYGISVNQVGNIIKGRQWTHILSPAEPSLEGDKAMLIT